MKQSLVVFSSTTLTLVVVLIVALLVGKQEAGTFALGLVVGEIIMGLTAIVLIRISDNG